MTSPQLRLIPLRPVVCSDYPSEVDLIVRVLVPSMGMAIERPMLNLGLVLDVSASMTVDAVSLYERVTRSVLQYLLPSDRISITVFNELTQVLVPNTWVLDKQKIGEKLAKIKPEGSSALYAGWMMGAIQVGQYLPSDALSRVIVFSDGCANVGETNVDTIAMDVNGLARRGISTSTIAVGSDINTDLLRAMARAGQGGHYPLADIDSITTLWEQELPALLPTIGSNVSIQVTPEAEIEILDSSSVSLPGQPDYYPLSDLVVGNPQELLLRLKVSPLRQVQRLCRFRLIWTPPHPAFVQTLEAELELPAVPFNTLEEFSFNPQVQRRVVRMMRSRAQKECVMSSIL